MSNFTKYAICAFLISLPIFLPLFICLSIDIHTPSIYDLKLSLMLRSLYRKDTYSVYKFLEKLYRKNESSFSKSLKMRDIFDKFSYDFMDKKISFQQYIGCMDNIFDLFPKCNLSGSLDTKKLLETTETMFLLEAYLWSSQGIITDAYSSCSESDKRILCDYCLEKLSDFQNQCKQFCIDENIDAHKLKLSLLSAIFNDCEIASYIDSLKKKTIEAGVKENEFDNLVNKYFSNKDFSLTPFSF